MGITESVIEDIKSRIDLAELISSYGIQVKHAGATAKACCPFHHEKTPSFNINSSKGFYHCFGCGESGDAIKFVQKQEGLTFVEAVKKLAEQCGVKIEEAEDPNAGLRKRLYSLMAELAAFYRRCLLQAKEGETARKYLESRALAGAVAEDWGIGYAPNGVANILRWAEKYKYTPEELEAAGVVKASLSLFNRVLPPQIPPEHPHDSLANLASSAYLLGEARPWITGDSSSPRRAAVLGANFDATDPVGAAAKGGRSAVIVLEEEPEVRS